MDELQENFGEAFPLGIVYIGGAVDDPTPISLAQNSATECSRALGTFPWWSRLGERLRNYKEQSEPILGRTFGRRYPGVGG
jgi:hypothetical protein